MLCFSPCSQQINLNLQGCLGSFWCLVHDISQQVHSQRRFPLPHKSRFIPLEKSSDICLRTSRPFGKFPIFCQAQNQPSWAEAQPHFCFPQPFSRPEIVEKKQVNLIQGSQFSQIIWPTSFSCESSSLNILFSGVNAAS